MRTKMRTHTCLVLAVLTVSGGLGLAGCDTIDWFADTMQGLVDTKKKLPGERKAVFPEGVPGVTPGVPQEYTKRPSGEGASEGAAKEGQASAEPKTANPPERKERPARRPPPQESAEAPKKPAAATPVPAQPAQPIQSQDATSSSPQTSPPQAPWPAAPPPGTFSR
jgi:hypothetical protein